MYYNFENTQIEVEILDPSTVDPSQLQTWINAGGLWSVSGGDLTHITSVQEITPAVVIAISTALK